MSDGTSIEWTDASWNPTRGCSMARGSELKGCLNCYAARLAARMLWGRAFARMTGNGPRWTGVVRLIPELLDMPLRWKRPKRVFVNSTSDLFHEALEFRDIAAVYGVMAWAQRHTFQVLTKRPDRRRAFFRWMGELVGPPTMVPPLGNMKTDPVLGAEMAAARYIPDGRIRAGPPMRFPQWPLHNVWEGVSVEDQETADARIPVLLETPAAVRFVSYEPALAEVDFQHYLTGHEEAGTPFDGARTVGGCVKWTPPLDWIIVGGESGPGARPCDLAWIRRTVYASRLNSGRVFVKQLGSYPINPLAEPRLRGDRVPLRDSKGGDPAEWPRDLRVREYPR